MYLIDVGTCHEAPTTPVRAERFDDRILAFLEPLIQTMFSSRTDSWVTLVEHTAVDAVRVRSTRCLGVRLAMTARQFIHYRSRNLNFTNWNITLQRHMLMLQALNTGFSAANIIQFDGTY